MIILLRCKIKMLYAMIIMLCGIQFYNKFVEYKDNFAYLATEGRLPRFEPDFKAARRSGYFLGCFL